MSFLSWIIFGALAGAVAGAVTGNERSGCLYNILIGVLGAFLGGFLMQFITGETFSVGFNFQSFIVAVLGSVLLLAITGSTRRGKKK